VRTTLLDNGTPPNLVALVEQGAVRGTLLPLTTRINKKEVLHCGMIEGVGSRAVTFGKFLGSAAKGVIETEKAAVKARGSKPAADSKRRATTAKTSSSRSRRK